MESLVYTDSIEAVALSECTLVTAYDVAFSLFLIYFFSCEFLNRETLKMFRIVKYTREIFFLVIIRVVLCNYLICIYLPMHGP